MKTLQEHYTAIKNGQGNKAQFLKHARTLFPEYFNQYTDFDTATNVLKSKQIINEAAGGVVSKGFDIFDWKKILAEEVKAEEKNVSKEVEDYAKSNFDNKDMKNADNINFNEIMKGFYCELKDSKNSGKTGDELKDIVVKNLAKDPLYYTKNGEFGVKDLGYTTEAPGLGEPKPAKGPHKSSGYGDLDTDKKVEKVKANVQDSLGDKEAKTKNPSKVKEMDVTPQNSPGVKKMKMPGKEKTIKLQENTDVLDHYLSIINSNNMGEEEAHVWLEDQGIPSSQINAIMNYAFPIKADKDIKDAFVDGGTDSLYETELKEGLSLSQYDNMSDQEIIQWAKKDGMGDFIEYDEVGELSNRRKLLSVLLGKELEYDNEYGDFDYDTRDQDVKWDDDDLDPAGGRGLSSHMESIAEQKLRSIIRNIIKEELNKESDMGQRLAAEYGTSDYIDPTSIKYSEDKEGSWNLEFIMEIPKNEVMDMDIKEADKYFSKEYGVNSYNGPGASFSKVYADTKDGKDYWIVSIYARGGYDI